jgi:hypothetical protein
MRRTHSITAATSPTRGEHRIRIRDTLATELFFGRYDPPESLKAEEERRQWVRDLWARARQGSWTRDVLVIEGEALDASRLDEGGHWVAFVETGDIWLYAHSRGTPIGQITLVRIADPASLVAAAAGG